MSTRQDRTITDGSMAGELVEFELSGDNGATVIPIQVGEINLKLRLIGNYYSRIFCVCI